MRIKISLHDRAEVTWQVLVLLLLCVISTARVPYSLAGSSGWCSQTARHTHVTDTPSLHGGKGSPSGVRCRRLLDIHTWILKLLGRSRVSRWDG